MAKISKKASKRSSPKAAAKHTAKRTKKTGKYLYKHPEHHADVYHHPKAPRCLHKSRDGKLVCKRFKGHAEKGSVGHYYVTPADLKRRIASWRERFIAA